MGLLEVRDLSKSFGGLIAVNHVSFSVMEGEIVALIGPNGAGKTTIFNILSGIFPPTSGEVFFKGQRITGLKSHQICALGLGRTFQTPHLFSRLTVLENVMLGRHARSRSGFLPVSLRLPRSRGEEEEIRGKAKEVLRFAGLEGREGEVPGNLPYGEQRLLEIARALATEPKLLMLDEPAAGLNEFETENLSQTLFKLKGAGITILLVEHDMSLVMGTSDRVIVLNYGEIIAEGKPEEVRKDEKVITAYLGE